MINSRFFYFIRENDRFFAFLCYDYYEFLR